MRLVFGLLVALACTAGAAVFEEAVVEGYTDPFVPIPGEGLLAPGWIPVRDSPPAQTWLLEESGPTTGAQGLLATDGDGAVCRVFPVEEGERYLFSVRFLCSDGSGTGPPSGEVAVGFDPTGQSSSFAASTVRRLRLGAGGPHQEASFAPGRWQCWAVPFVAGGSSVTLWAHVADDGSSGSGTRLVVDDWALTPLAESAFLWNGSFEYRHALDPRVPHGWLEWCRMLPPQGGGGTQRFLIPVFTRPDLGCLVCGGDACAHIGLPRAGVGGCGGLWTVLHGLPDSTVLELSMWVRTASLAELWTMDQDAALKVGWGSCEGPAGGLSWQTLLPVDEPGYTGLYTSFAWQGEGWRRLACQVATGDLRPGVNDESLCLAILLESHGRIEVATVDCVSLAPPGAGPPVLTRPSLLPVEGGAEVAWSTDIPASTICRWGTDPANLEHLFEDASLSTEHSVVLPSSASSPLWVACSSAAPGRGEGCHPPVRLAPAGAPPSGGFEGVWVCVGPYPAVAGGADGLRDTPAVGDETVLFGVAQGCGMPQAPAVCAGPDGFLSTSPSHDDRLYAGVIYAGPDGVCAVTAVGDDLQLIPQGRGRSDEPCLLSPSLEQPLLAGDDTVVDLFGGAVPEGWWSWQPSATPFQDGVPAYGVLLGRGVGGGLRVCRETGFVWEGEASLRLESATASYGETGGLLARISTTPGRSVTLRARVAGAPHYAADASPYVGRRVVGTRLGIDPLGRDDPGAPGVVWSEWAWYHPEPQGEEREPWTWYADEVSAEAATEAVTVYLQAISLVPPLEMFPPYLNGTNAAYFDGVEVEGALVSHGLSVAPGFNLVGVGVEPADAEASSVLSDLVEEGEVLENALFAYGRSTGYLVYPAGFTAMESSRGYWLKATAAHEAVVEGLPAAGLVALEAGWNLIAPPSVLPVPFAALRVRQGAVELSWAEAVAAGLVQDTTYRYLPGVGYVGCGPSAAPPDDRMLPGWGYWLRSYAPGVSLVFP